MLSPCCHAPLPLPLPLSLCRWLGEEEEEEEEREEDVDDEDVVDVKLLKKVPQLDFFLPLLPLPRTPPALLLLIPPPFLSILGGVEGLVL